MLPLVALELLPKSQPFLSICRRQTLSHDRCVYDGFYGQAR